MNAKQKQIVLLVFLILLLFVLNYSFLDRAIESFLTDSETVVVGRVIDGDTFVVGNQSVRLLGINSPEKGELYSGEAKMFLEESVLNKSVRLEFGIDKYDLYNRLLAYVFVDGKNVNLELVQHGFANYYFPSGQDKYYSDFVSAWESCLAEGKNLCELSTNKCTTCVVLKDLNVVSQKVIFENVCRFDCDLTGWWIKDEGRKKFVFSNVILKSGREVSVDAEDFNEDYVWTKSGDTLFLRDAEGKLVLWKGY